MKEVLVLFDRDNEVVSVLSGDSYYLHNNSDILCEEEGADHYQFSWLKEAD